MNLKTLVIVFATVLGCSTTRPSQLDEVRFRDAPVVWAIQDEKNTPNMPRERLFLRNLYFFQQSFVRPTERGLDRVVVGPADNVNALDEVPNSTWFMNRIGERDLSVSEIHRGPRLPNTTVGPAEGPWKVLSTKVGGVSPGFIIKDKDGQRFILKFDAPEAPELETASDVVCQRLLWAIGYHVPDDEIIYFKPSRLALAEDAKERDAVGNKKPLTNARLQEILGPLRKNKDGHVRGLASRFLPGIPLGGFPQLGTRDDDPNDLIPHERRREVRGAWLFFAWLDHTDVKEDNSLDIYMSKGDRHFVRHYLLDFGKALGGMAYIDRVPMDGFAYYLDLAQIIQRWSSFGFVTNNWETLRVPSLKGVGRIDAEAFEPDLWKPFYPYIPFDVRDHRDDFWAAKILRKIRPEHIKAAIEVARYSSVESKDYLQKILVARQKKLLRWAYSRSNAISNYRVEEQQLCFDDLWHLDGFGQGATNYRLEWFDQHGAVIHSKNIETNRSICTPVPSDASTYAVLRLHNYRMDTPKMVDVHVVKDESPVGFHVVGIRRH